MLGKMTERPLLISDMVAHAAAVHGDTEIVSVETDGQIDRSTWQRLEQNARKLASALRNLGISDQQCCATIAWNNRRHLEIYFGVSGAGFVCHTINPRLSPENLVYIVNHAQDQVIFIDSTFVPLIANVRSQLKTVKHIVLMGPHDKTASDTLEGLLFYDELLKQGDAGFTWPVFDETRPSSLCYTSGTTGNPKGVIYSHRSTVLHSLGANQPDGLALSAKDSVLPVVPMFHVNAWGVPYVAASQGARLVLPGPGLDGASLVKLIDGEKVTIALGVPTIWMGLLSALKDSGSKASSLERTVVGGSALPPSMIPTFRDIYGVELIHAWGMTETSPVGSVNQLLAKHQALPSDEQAAIRLGQGRPPFGVSLRIVDETGARLPHDGETEGGLQIRGHWVVDQYFGQSETALTADGWFDTGDVATIDANGFMIIRDRSKDIIKSGGEWISSVELENIAIGHEQVANAAAIAARHQKWDERPVVIVVPVEGATLTEEDVLTYYQGKVPRWQVPDRAILVEALPIGSTGKVLKNKLRAQFGDILWEKQT